MGSTYRVARSAIAKEDFVPAQITADYVAALAGNPNTGKSTVFNALTGLNQHTGNWPGKTVSQARGFYRHQGKNIVLVDLPGTYSLLANSLEEEVARDFICFAKPEVTVVIVDATCLERNLNLVLQVLEITGKVVVCLNLIDEAERKGLCIDVEQLTDELGVPVVPTAARSGRGMALLKDWINIISADESAAQPKPVQYPDPVEEAIGQLETHLRRIHTNGLSKRWIALRLLEGDNGVIEAIRNYGLAGGNLEGVEVSMGHRSSLDDAIKQGHELSLSLGEESQVRDIVVTAIYRRAEAIADRVAVRHQEVGKDWDRKIDDILTSRLVGYPLMLALLGFVLWLTVIGANYPSQVLTILFSTLEDQLTIIFLRLGIPDWFHGIVVLGTYRGLAWVVAVMLPPMAIFFPLFTLLEDLGYLPRIAFNLDNLFKRAGAHGKQALTMAMGFGCNAAGVMATRIINSPRERMIAIVTNNFMPCNGRFPLLITMSSVFLGAGVMGHSSLLASLTVVGMVLLGIAVTFFTSYFLSKTLLKGVSTSFALELPPYRRPQVVQVIVRSIFDRTLFVLWRAVKVAAPAGALVWFLANVNIGGISMIEHVAGYLDPFARIMGLDGFILLAFILGLPANEIVIPILLMSYLGSGALMEFDSLEAMKMLLVSRGWTWLTALNVMIFSLLHFPCGTTLMTIRHETGGWKWTIIAALLTTTTAVMACLLVAQGARLLQLVP